MEKSREQEDNLHIAFTDFTKAFDCVNRELLFAILEKLGCPAELSRVIKKLYTNVHARLIIDGELSEPIKYNSGFKQGSVDLRALSTPITTTISQARQLALGYGGPTAWLKTTARLQFLLLKAMGSVPPARPLKGRSQLSHKVPSLEVPLGSHFQASTKRLAVELTQKSKQKFGIMNTHVC